MIFYKCLDCGEIFPENEMVYQKHIERHDEITVETLSEGRCPKCKSENLEEVDECYICGKGFDGLNVHFCPECEKAAFTFDNMLKYAEEQPECNFETIKINPFYKMMIDDGFINLNGLLMRDSRYILRTLKEIDGKYKHGITDNATSILDDFVSADYSDYADWYKEHYGEDKK